MSQVSELVIFLTLNRYVMMFGEMDSLAEAVNVQVQTKIVI